LSRTQPTSQVAPFATIRSSQIEPGPKRKSRTDDIPVTPLMSPIFPNPFPSSPFLSRSRIHGAARATGQRVPDTAAEATRAAAIGAAPGTASATRAPRAESANTAVPGPLLSSPPTAPHRSPVPALAVSCPPTPPSQSPTLRSGPPPTSVPLGEICVQDDDSPVPVFAAADATGFDPAATSADRAAMPWEPLSVASRASPAPRFRYVPS
jgi:hypothetical protein